MTSRPQITHYDLSTVTVGHKHTDNTVSPLQEYDPTLGPVSCPTAPPAAQTKY